MSNSKLWLYIGLLLAGTLAAPVKAQTPESESVPDLETNSATVLSSGTANDSEGVSEALTQSQERPEDKVQLPQEKSSQALNPSAELGTPQVNLAGLVQNSETPVEESMTAASALSQSDPGISFKDRVSVKLDNPPEVVPSSEALPPSTASVTSEPSSNTNVEEEITPVAALANRGESAPSEPSATSPASMAQADPVLSPDVPLSPSVDDLQDSEAAAMDQVTNVTQLRDVQPTDWAYEALRSLVERYGCIAGYPDGTFRGNRAMTRYEFAAGLNSCLQQIERLLVNLGDVASQDDLKTLQRLLDEFNTELVTLKTRVDTLEGRTAFLEDNQFSTTTNCLGRW
jgi:hypothetical protein